MKTFLLTSLLFLFIFPGYGQIAPKVADIVAEREGDNINIFYNIADKDPNVIYKVRINAALDGKAPVALRSVSGDVGDNVRGGKARYKIVWEALKEVNQIGTAEFFITAEKVPAMTNNVKPQPTTTVTSPKPRNRKWMLAADMMYNVDTEETNFGFTIAYFKRWGGYLTYNDYRITAGPIYTLNHPSNTTMSLYLGGGAFYYSEFDFYNGYYDEGYNPGAEAGFITAIRWFTFSMGGALDLFEAIPSFTASIGVRF